LQHPPPTLDYRSPATGAHRVQRVMRQLEAAETFGAASVGIKLLVGIPLCLLAPLVVTLTLKRIEWGWRTDFLPGFEVTFLLAAAVLVPVLMGLARRTRGQTWADNVQDGMTAESSRYDVSSTDGFRLRSPAMEWQVYTDIALAGPRLVWSVMDAVRGKVAVDPPLRVVAAEIAIGLFEAGESMSLRQLVRPNRPPWLVARAVRYLLRRDWLCISPGRDRVWLTTPARERLAKL
jgi:hypothetical protein